MVTEVERLAVLIEANTKSYERAMARVEGRTGKAIAKSTGLIGRLDRSLKTAEKSALAFGRGIASAFGPAALLSVAGFSAAIAKTFSDLGRITDVADKVGVTTGQLQELRFAAKQSGIEISQTDVALQRFSRRIAEAARGSGELNQIIKDNNIQLRGSNGELRPLVDILGDYANLIQNTTDDQEQLRLAFKAFDTEGAQLVLVLENGADGLAKLRQEAQDLNLVINEESVRTADRFADQWEKTAERVKIGFQKAVVATLGFLDRLKARLQDPELQQDFLRRTGAPTRAFIDPPEVNGQAPSRFIRGRPGDLDPPVFDPFAGRTPPRPQIKPTLDLRNTDRLSFEIRDSTSAVNELNDAVEKLDDEQVKSFADSFTLVGAAGEVAAVGLTRAFDDFLETGKFSFRNFAESAVKDLARVAFQVLVVQRLASAFGSFGSPGGSPVGGNGGFSFGSVIGLARGGSGTFGGRPGVDRNVLSLNGTPIARVSRGEDFAIRPQGQGGQGANINVNITQPVVIQGMNPQDAAGTRAQLAQLKEEIKSETIVALQGRVARTPGFLRPAGA